MTGVSRSIESTHPLSLTALKALASIAGIEGNTTFNDAASSSNDDEFAIKMTISSTNAFTKSTTTYSATGLTGCARSLSKSVPESGLWGGELTSAQEPLVEGWIEVAASTLVPSAYSLSDARVKEPNFQNQVTELATKIETHLSKSKSSFLVGANATAADIIVSILLIHAATRTGGVSFSDKTKGWLTSILTNEIVVSAIGTLDIPSPPAAAPAAKKRGESSN